MAMNTISMMMAMMLMIMMMMEMMMMMMTMMMMMMVRVGGHINIVVVLSNFFGYPRITSLDDV